MNDCDQFPYSSRRRQICLGETGIPLAKVNRFRELHGIAAIPSGTQNVEVSQPKSPRVLVGATPDRKASGKQSSCCGGARKVTHPTTSIGPGSRLIATFKSAGFEACEACYALAERMNEWGDAGCDERIEEIVADILPRALAWEREKVSWWTKLVPEAVTAAAIRVIVRRTIKTATPQRSVSQLSQRGEKVIRTAEQRRPPLIGSPIDRTQLVTHILYHVLPLSGVCEPLWRRHVDWLREVRNQFNGRMIVGIATPGVDRPGQQFVPLSEVKAAFSGMDAEFIPRRNDRIRGEGVTFPAMLQAIKTDNPDEVFFYGHTKGVTREHDGADKPPHLWARAMFATVFGNRDAVVDTLDTAGVTGAFRMNGGLGVGRPGVGPHWFYSGTFFAARSVDVFRRNWQHLLNHYGCVEQWPRMMFDRETESACVFFDGVDNLYDPTYWHDQVTPAFMEWQNARLRLR